jgi:hypothetical protein
LVCGDDFDLDEDGDLDGGVPRAGDEGIGEEIGSTGYVYWYIAMMSNGSHCRFMPARSADSVFGNMSEVARALPVPHGITPTGI